MRTVIIKESEECPVQVYSYAPPGYDVTVELDRTVEYRCALPVLSEILKAQLKIAQAENKGVNNDEAETSKDITAIQNAELRLKQIGAFIMDVDERPFDPHRSFTLTPSEAEALHSKLTEGLSISEDLTTKDILQGKIAFSIARCLGAGWAEVIENSPFPLATFSHYIAC